LRKERDRLAQEADYARQFYETVTQDTLNGHQYSAAERKEIDSLLMKRERLLRRFTKVEDALTAIEKSGAVIRKHCTATPDEIQAAIKAYKKKLRDAESLVLGLEFARVAPLQEAKASLRRLTSGLSDAGKLSAKQLAALAREAGLSDDR
jgi:hypothetical protein